jgi:glycine oxidase
MIDVCIIGGGIIGLSIARELAGRGLSVHVVEREASRDTASWAAAGIFPPAPACPGGGPGERLTAWSDRLHREWSEALRAETGIDNGLHACGGVHLAGSEPGLGRLRGAAAEWRARGAACEWLDSARVAAIEPALLPAVRSGAVRGGYLLPEEMQIRPPRHLEALRASCHRRGVAFSVGTVRDVLLEAGVIRGVVADAGGGVPPAGRYVIAAGAWSGGLAARLGIEVETRPIRGQIALFTLPRRTLGRVVNYGLDYLVPRPDGRLLVGSTLEDAGFAATTTTEAIERLRDVAHRLLGPLPDAVVDRAWAGLRPGTVDGLPSIGPVPGCANGYLAAGHFRAGLHQSTGTSVLIADMITGRPPAIDAAAFAPGRRPGPPNRDSVEAYLARAATDSA